MKFYTPEDLEKGETLETDLYYLYIKADETSSKLVPFLNTRQQKDLEAFGTCICSFTDESIANVAINELKELKAGDISANLISNGKLLNSI